jgi:D-alanyl-D-alanine carboxypeptidase/D-alanyl-D-alanine-endopeptidase (penicillin-binding protein 4)
MKYLAGLLVLLTMTGARGDEAILREFLGHRSLKTASVGVFVIPMEGETPVLEWQADTGLIPASTMKAITTATALQVLGSEYVFETKVYLKEGDLVLKGGGDPTFGTTSLTGDFEAMFAALKAMGVTEIAGDLVMDPSRFESRTTPNDWPWGDVGNYYGAGPSGLNYHKNSFALTFMPGRVGAAARLSRVWPKPPGVEFENHMRTGSAGSGDQGYVYGGPGATRISMRGTVPAGEAFTIHGALPDPPRMCATALKVFLEEEGIPVRGGVRVEKVSVGELEPIFVQKSPSLATIAKETNHRSVNLYADSIFKALTEQGTTAASVAKVREYWGEQGVDLTGFVMLDGSGLSPRDTVTARQMGMIFKKARQHEKGQSFVDSLPIAGTSGTLVGFGRGTVLEGRVQAKSGSLTRVRTYAGFFKGRSGRMFAFSILINNEIEGSKTAIVDTLVDLIDKY